MHQNSNVCRAIGLALATSLVLAACAGFETTTPVSRDLGEDSPTTTARTSTTLTTTTTEPPESSSLPPASDVLITPSGVVVAMLEDNGTGFRVRTPCGDEMDLAAGSPVGAVRVVLDPGHGGESDPGAQGPNGLTEAVVNLQVAVAVQRLLGKEGIGTLLTRTDDYGSTLGVRSALADHANAELMVSIHHNAPTHGQSDGPGTEVFVQNASEDSHRLGGLLYESIVGALEVFDINWSAAPDSGVLQVLNTRGTDAYGMLRNPETVTALAELGYISNRPEAELFATSEYVTVAAEALAGAILSYLESDEEALGVPQGQRVFNPQPGISGGACDEPPLT